MTASDLFWAVAFLLGGQLLISAIEEWGSGNRVRRAADAVAREIRGLSYGLTDALKAHTKQLERQTQLMERVELRDMEAERRERAQRAPDGSAAVMNDDGVTNRDALRMIERLAQREPPRPNSVTEYSVTYGNSGKTERLVHCWRCKRGFDAESRWHRTIRNESGRIFGKLELCKLPGRCEACAAGYPRLTHADACSAEPGRQAPAGAVPAGEGPERAAGPAQGVRGTSEDGDRGSDEGPDPLAG